MKKTKIITSFLLLLYLMISNVDVAFAQQVVNTNETMSLESIQTEVQNMKHDIELIGDINNKILNTIYWALGGLIGVFIAIVGLNFFQNFLLNKKKIDNISEEIKNEIKENINKLSKDINENNEKYLIQTSDNLKIEIQKGVSSEFDKINKKIEPLQKNYSDLKDEFEDLQRESLISKAFEFKNNHQMGYIINLTKVLEYDIEKKWDWRINESIEFINDCLDDLSPNSDALTSLQKVLDKLPPEYKIPKQHIESKMKL